MLDPSYLVGSLWPGNNRRTRPDHRGHHRESAPADTRTVAHTRPAACRWPERLSWRGSLPARRFARGRKCAVVPLLACYWPAHRMRQVIRLARRESIYHAVDWSSNDSGQCNDCKRVLAGSPDLEPLLIIAQFTNAHEGVHRM